MFRQALCTLGIATACSVLALPVFAQQSDTQDKPFDVRSSIGDLHVGKDADAKQAGLPLYPGARPKKNESDDPLNFGLLTESFGLKVIVAKYETDDPAPKVIAYYQDKMKKYGKVLACDSANDNSGFHADDDQEISKPLTCQGDNKGPVKELKVGTEGNAHIVAVEPGDGKGTTFTIVYLRRRGKSGGV